MAQAPDSKAKKKDLDQAIKGLEATRKFIKLTEKIGVEAPKYLTKSLKVLEIALKEGKIIGDSAKEASEAAEQFRKELLDACKKVDDVQQTVCEVGVERQWQWRSVVFTLDPKNKNSVISKVIQKNIQMWTPAPIIKQWEKVSKDYKK